MNMPFFSRGNSQTNRKRLFVALLSALSFAGCPGKLDNWQQFVGGGEGGVPTCSIPAASVELQLIRPRCATAGCHNRAEHQGNLDLVSPGIAERVVGQASTCAGKLLVDPANRAQSYILEKLGASPTCGRQMPMGTDPFSADELACVRLWINTLNPGENTDGGVMDVPDPPRDVPNPPRDRPDPMGDMPTPTDGPVDMDVPNPMDIPTPNDIPNPRDVPNRDVPNPIDVPSPMDADSDA